ncbi:hypothetical protein EDB83DRAFT_2320336 [Lactarius deliciosus]|nr:hypothetical protein EDB83DRAFT_2320336 [Lactarius deliciosus]
MPLAPARALLGRSSVWLVLLPIGATVGTRRFYEAVNPNFDSVGLGKRKMGQGGSDGPPEEAYMLGVILKQGKANVECIVEMNAVIYDYGLQNGSLYSGEQPSTRCLVDTVGGFAAPIFFSLGEAVPYGQPGNVEVKKSRGDVEKSAAKKDSNEQRKRTQPHDQIADDQPGGSITFRQFSSAPAARPSSACTSKEKALGYTPVCGTKPGGFGGDVLGSVPKLTLTNFFLEISGEKTRMSRGNVPATRVLAGEQKTGMTKLQTGLNTQRSRGCSAACAVTFKLREVFGLREGRGLMDRFEDRHEHQSYRGDTLTAQTTTKLTDLIPPTHPTLHLPSIRIGSRGLAVVGVRLEGEGDSQPAYTAGLQVSNQARSKKLATKRSEQMFTGNALEHNDRGVVESSVGHSEDVSACPASDTQAFGVSECPTTGQSDRQPLDSGLLTVGQSDIPAFPTVSSRQWSVRAGKAGLCYSVTPATEKGLDTAGRPRCDWDWWVMWIVPHAAGQKSLTLLIDS